MLEVETGTHVLGKLIRVLEEVGIFVVFVENATAKVGRQPHGDVTIEFFVVQHRSTFGLVERGVGDGLALSRGGAEKLCRVDVGVVARFLAQRLCSVQFLNVEFHRGQRVAIILIVENAQHARVGHYLAVGIGYQFRLCRQTESFGHVKLCQKATGGHGLRLGINHAAQIALVGVGQHRSRLSGLSGHLESVLVGRNVVFIGHHAAADGRGIVATRSSQEGGGQKEEGRKAFHTMGENVSSHVTTILRIRHQQSAGRSLHRLRRWILRSPARSARRAARHSQ